MFLIQCGLQISSAKEMAANCRPIFPTIHSVNDGIRKELCSVLYLSIDDRILTLGSNSPLVKIDIKSTYQVHPTDCHLLAMQWDA